MSETTINFENRVSGILTNVDSVEFSDATVSFGVLRKDNNAIVIPAGTALGNPSIGVYSYTFTDPAPDLIYRYVLKVVRAGVPTYTEKETSMPPTSYSYDGRYATYTGMIAKFGRISIVKWASTDAADNDAILAAITLAITKADNYIDAALAGSIYVVPFDSVKCPQLIRELADTLAAVYLYESQGTMNFDEENGQPQHKLKIQKKEATRDLMRIKLGMLSLFDTDGTDLTPEDAGPIAGIDSEDTTATLEL